MKIPGMNICSFDPYDNFNNPKNTKYANSPLIGEYVSFGIVYDTIAFDAKAINLTDAATTVSITIGSNNNRICIAHVDYDGSTTNRVSTLKIGTTAFTKLTSIQGSFGVGFMNSEVWYLIAPPTGSQTLTITWGSTPSHSIFSAYSYYNVDQTNGISSSTVNTISGQQASPVTVSITPATQNSWIACDFCSGNSGSSSPSDTSLYLAQVDSGSFLVEYSQYKSNPTIGSSNSLSWTSGSTTVPYAMIIYEILAHHTP